jgi:uncharacterized linocin/CFP29 family protein
VALRPKQQLSEGKKMYPPRRVGRDTGELTDEELRYITQELIDAAVPELHARDVFAKEPLPSVGIRTIRNYTKTSMSQAVLSMEAEMVSVDRIQLASGDVNVPAIYKDFIINWRDIEAIRDFGGSLEMENGRDAARQVAEEEVDEEGAEEEQEEKEEEFLKEEIKKPRVFI